MPGIGGDDRAADGSAHPPIADRLVERLGVRLPRTGSIWKRAGIKLVGWVASFLCGEERHGAKIRCLPARKEVRERTCHPG